ncbi:MAG: hypothetical protein WBX38_17010 [Candidatus Sulfotelmatobacter sp.]
MDTKIVKNFRAVIFLPSPKPLELQLVGDDFAILQDRTRSILRSLLNGTPRFEPATPAAAADRVMLIYHEGVGPEAIGCITEYSMPRNLSVLDRELRQEAA